MQLELIFYLLFRFEDTPYSEIGARISSFMAVTITPNDLASLDPLCEIIAKELGLFLSSPLNSSLCLLQ